MKFADEDKALHLLENISYYRFSGYWYPLLTDKENHVFKPNVDFETAFSLYKFDRELRKLIISELEKIEVAVRSKMAYIMSLLPRGCTVLCIFAMFVLTMREYGTVR